MANLASMPKLVIPSAELLPFGKAWQANGKCLTRTPPYASSQLGKLFDQKVGQALAVMLGGVPIVTPVATALLPSTPDCVEVGACTIIGGIRPQRFDVGYRPDGVRFVFDSKTLNDTKSVGKNYQNMINDLATEATTVHIRFPYALVAFLVAIPTPCLVSPHREALTRRLEGLTGRHDPSDNPHSAEAIALVLWETDTGKIDKHWPVEDSNLRIEKFSAQIETVYMKRYAGLPPHAKLSPSTTGQT